MTTIGGCGLRYAPRGGNMWRLGIFAILATAWSACGDSSSTTTPDGGAPPVNVEGPVTITFLQHGNPAYGMANGAAFRAYELAHPNVHIKVNTLDYHTLTAKFLSELKNDRLDADLT